MLHYLGNEQYGMWLTISAITAMLGPLDLGIGNGLRQVLSHAAALDSPWTARRAVSTATLLLTGLGAILLASIPIALAVVDWPAVYNVTTSAAVADAAPTTGVLLAAFAVGLPLSVIAIVQSAMQVAYITASWSIVGSIATLAAILGAIALGATMPALAAASVGVALVAIGANGVVYFRGRARPIAPEWSGFDSSVGRTLVGTGLVFLLLQVAMLVGYQIDNLVIAQILGAAAVPGYAIPMRVFLVAPTLIGIATMPLWPAYREAIARRDGAWVARTLRRSVALTIMASGLSSAVLVAVGPALIELWVGPSIQPSLPLLVALGLWAVALSLSSTLAMLLNAAGVIKLQAALAILMAASNLAISIVLVGRIGILGAVVGSLTAQAVFILLPFAVLVPQILQKVQIDQQLDDAALGARR